VNGLGTFQGQSITFFNTDVRNSYSVRWNFSVQRQLPGQIVLEVAYIGNHAVHLPISKNLDYVPRQYLSTSLYRDAADNAVNTLLTGSVPNPFQGLLPNTVSLGTSTTTSRQQLLLPFPQYTGITEQYNNAGESYYNSLNVRLQKRFTHGLVIIENFTYSNLIERTSYLNASDPAPEKRIGGDSRPTRFSTEPSAVGRPTDRLFFSRDRRSPGVMSSTSVDRCT
jgi:hypothetical protein